jgi:hypothetical protein
MRRRDRQRRIKEFTLTSRLCGSQRRIKDVILKTRRRGS